MQSCLEFAAFISASLADLLRRDANPRSSSADPRAASIWNRLSRRAAASSGAMLPAGWRRPVGLASLAHDIINHARNRTQTHDRQGRVGEARKAAALARRNREDAQAAPQERLLRHAQM